MSTLPIDTLLADGRPRRLVLSLYEEATEGWPFLTTIMERAFAAERVPGEERGLIAETLAELVRHRRTVQHALGEDAGAFVQLLGMLLLTGRITPEQARWALPDFDVAAVEALPARINDEADPVRRLALRHSFPDWMAKLFLDEAGERAEALAAALNRPPSQTLRVNTLLGTRDLVQASLAADGVMSEPTTYAPQGLRVKERTDVFRTTAFREGLFEMQDEASQLICEAVAPPPGSTVVDACAGAGGKTLGIGAQLKGRGRVVALDINSGRLDELRRRARRAQLSNVQALLLEGETRPQVTAARVLVDAPCSGLGALRRNPEARWRLQPDDLTRLSQQQQQIVEQALTHVAPGGRLIYATCSFARAEGEDVLARILEAHPQLQHVRIKEILGGARSQPFTDAQGFNLRTWPDLHDMDGFFCAVVRRPA